MTAKYFGIMAEFDSPAAILAAAEQVRAAGYHRWEAFTPFPIHGLDRVAGYRNSLVGWFALVFGGAAFVATMGLIWFCNAFDYPLIVGGKPMFSPFAAFPPSYELTILFGSFGALLGMLFLNRLPRLHHPLLKNRRFAKVTHDKFFIVVECDDPKYSDPGTVKLLEAAGSKHIEMVEE